MCYLIDIAGVVAGKRRENDINRREEFMTTISNFEIFVSELLLVTVACYVGAVMIYCKHAQYRPAIRKAVFIWALLWLLDSVVNLVEFEHGNSEIIDGLFWVGLPATYPIDFLSANRFFSYRAEFYILSVMLFINWAGVAVMVGVAVKKIKSALHRSGGE